MREFVWNILLVVDDSEIADRASECVIDLALSGLKARVNLYYVKDDEPVALPSEELERKKMLPMVSRANKKLLDVAEKLRTAGVDYDILGYHIGIADEAIRRLEKEFKPDLIVIGVDKKGALKKIFAGNAEQKIVFDTDAPVVVVKPKYTPKIKELIKEIPVIEVREMSAITQEEL